MVMIDRFCWECKNFEGREHVDQNSVCANGHHPGVSCNDFSPKNGHITLVSHTRFCSGCQNFEDQRPINGTVICAKNHHPGVNCMDFDEFCMYACARAAERYYGWCSSCNEIIAKSRLL